MRRYRLIAEEHKLPLAAPRAQSVSHLTCEVFFEGLKPGKKGRYTFREDGTRSAYRTSSNVRPNPTSSRLSPTPQHR
jgi:hypothetical protein